MGGEYIFNDDYIEVVKLEDDEKWFGLSLSDNYVHMNNGHGAEFFFGAYKYLKYVPLVSTSTYLAKGVISIPSSVLGGDETMTLSFLDLNDHFTISKEERSIYTEREEIVEYLARIDAVDKALQGTWKADNNQKTTITFDNGRFVYDYIRVSDGKQEVNKGEYKIKQDFFTLKYDNSDFEPEIEYSFENGELVFYSEQGDGEKFIYVKQ